MKRVLRLDPPRLTARQILARELEVEPDELTFHLGSHGKPAVCSSDGARLDIEFNVSHSRNLTLIALSVDGPVGLDVEHVGRRRISAGLMKRCFAAAEVSALNALPDRDRRLAALQLWTAKEAYVKALGIGLTLPLNGIEIPLTADGRIGPTAVAGGPEDAPEIAIRKLDLGSEYVGSLAVRPAGTLPLGRAKIESVEDAGRPHTCRYAVD